MAARRPDTPDGPRRLPSGRHGLSRTYVVRNQRERIIDAVIQAVRDRGYAGLTIEDVIARAGVSRRTFYEHFANKEEAFLAAYDLIAAHLADAVGAAFRSGGEWVDQVRLALAAFLGQLAADPAIAHVCVVEILAAGPRALDRRSRAMSRFRDFVTPGPGSPMDAGTAPPLAPEAAVGGIYEIVYERILSGDATTLPELLPDLLYSVLLPFAGAEIAREQYDAVLREREVAGRSDARP